MHVDICLLQVVTPYTLILLIHKFFQESYSHSPVSFKLNIKALQKTRFNTSLLKDQEFDSYFKKEWNLYGNE